jgi:hypothetical protein
MRQPTTGDAHLLALDAFRGIRIMTPTAFLEADNSPDGTVGDPAVGP